jgi:CheY-like chemotaxis protein
LPRLNGLETARLIREQPWGKSIFLVAVTGYGQEEDRRRSLAAGFDYHMVKPIDFAELRKKLSEICA